MRKMIEFKVFFKHKDWYTMDESGNYFIPTEKAPPEAVEAMEYCNKLVKEDIKNDSHRI